MNKFLGFGGFGFGREGLEVWESRPEAVNCGWELESRAYSEGFRDLPV